jgi:hypothetical protein
MKPHEEIVMTGNSWDDDDLPDADDGTRPTVKMNRDLDPVIETLIEVDPIGHELKTRIYRGPGETEEVADLSPEAPMADPVVGWLVVTYGPGRGASLQLGYGRNSIGRAPSERVALDFGDEQISRIGHAVLTYDPRGRKFYLQSGSGPNLTYIEGRDEPVLTPVILRGGEELLLGTTRLRFVPFCGPDFDWHAE